MRDTTLSGIALGFVGCKEAMKSRAIELMKGNHSTLLGKSLLGEPSGCNLIIKPDPGSAFAHDAIAVTYFDDLNKQNYTLLLCRSSIFAVRLVGLGRPR